MALTGSGSSDPAAPYRSITAGRRVPAYPETDLATRDRIRARSCATNPIAGLGLAHPVAAAAGLHRRAGEPGHRVCRCSVAGTVLWAVIVHLGDADRADFDLPDDRLLRRRPPGRPPPRRETSVSVNGRGRSSYGGHPDRLATDPFTGPDRLRAGVRPAGPLLTDFRDRAVRRAGVPARPGLALRDPASHPAARNRRQRGRRCLCPVHAG